MQHLHNTKSTVYNGRGRGRYYVDGRNLLSACQPSPVAFVVVHLVFNVGFTEVVPTVGGERSGRGSLYLTATLPPPPE